MEKNERIIFNAQLRRLVIPIATQQLMMALVSVTDAVMLGLVSQDALSAVSLAGQVQFVYSLFLFAIMSGVSIFTAQYWGINDKKSVEKILGIGLKISVLISLPFAAAAMLCPELLMRAFASEPVLIAYGAEYLRAVAFSYILLSVSQIYLCILKNCGKTVLCSVISSVSVVINAVLNAFLIFGLWIFPEMGITGAAVATVISKVVELVWTLAVMLGRDSIKIRLRLIIHNDKLLKKDFRKYTLPILGNEIVWGCGFTMYSVIMGQLGSDSAAANSIANIIKNLTICFSTGVASASGIMVGNLLGSGQLEKAREYGARLTKIAVISGIASGVVILCLIPAVPLFGTLSEAAQDYLRVMLAVCSYYVAGKAVNMVTIAGVFPAGGDSKFGFKCDAVTMWCVTVPLGLVSAFLLKLPVTVVYIIINIDEIVKLPAVFAHYKKYRWLKNLTRRNEPEEKTA